jgi:hypothetical protein
MDRTQRTGAGYREIVFISCLVLASLLLQVLPFTFYQPLSAVDAAGDGTAHYIQPLQVCGDQQGPGGFIADIPWITASPRTLSFPLRAQSLAAVSFPDGPEGFSPPVYRPPRSSFSLT